MLSIVETTSLCSPKVRVHSNFTDRWVARAKEASIYPGSFIGDLTEKNAPQKWRIPGNLAGCNASSGAALVGLSIPIRPASGEIVSFVLAVEEASGLSCDIDEVIPFAHTFAAYMFDQYIQVIANDDDRKKLTQRELDCLFWACEGKTTWEISKIIDISERTVVFHLKNTEKKLQAKSRQHAVALATMRGLIKPKIPFGNAPFRRMDGAAPANVRAFG
jgi:LuxR family transcriptional activator of bioluminescence operon